MTWPPFWPDDQRPFCQIFQSESPKKMMGLAAGRLPFILQRTVIALGRGRSGGKSGNPAFRRDFRVG